MFDRRAPEASISRLDLILCAAFANSSMLFSSNAVNNSSEYSGVIYMN